MEPIGVDLFVWCWIAFMVIGVFASLFGAIGYHKRLKRFEEKPDKTPVLSRDIFKLPNCPGWARYAAVDEDGRAHVFEYKPKPRLDRWSNGGESQYIGYYRTIDWEKDYVVKLTLETIIYKTLCFLGIVYLHAALSAAISIVTLLHVIAVCQIVKEF